MMCFSVHIQRFIDGVSIFRTRKYSVKNIMIFTIKKNCEHEMCVTRMKKNACF